MRAVIALAIVVALAGCGKSKEDIEARHLKDLGEFMVKCAEFGFGRVQCGFFSYGSWDQKLLQAKPGDVDR